MSNPSAATKFIHVRFINSVSVNHGLDLRQVALHAPSSTFPLSSQLLLSFAIPAALRAHMDGILCASHPFSLH
jgi:hypothetical protein